MKLLNRLFISLCECMTGKSSAFLLGAGVFLYAMPPLTLAQNTPLFTPSFTGNALVDTSLSQGYYAPNLSFPSDQPVQITGPAEVTNATQIYVLFLSDSLGHTNLSDATANTGFQLAGVGSASISGIVDPPTNPNPSNYYYSAVGPDIENQAWMLINFTPGTNNSIVTNNLQVIAVNGNNNQTANWVLTNLNLVVRPPQQPPPYSEVRFYNSSTNPSDQVFILPTCKGLSGCGFWWSNTVAANNWTNWMTTTTNMTVSLADIGISGTNTQNKPYYSIYTTNFPNAAWFVSYNGGHLKAPTNASGQWDGTTTQGAGPNVAQPTSASTSGLWFGYEWNAFELTLDGNPEDVGDTTYINQFSIPMVLRVFTNSYADAEAGIFTNKDSRNYYKIGGWTNSSISLLSNLVAQMTIAFANGLITNSAGVPVMVAGPSSAGIGALAPPWTPPPLTNNAQNVWPKFTTYFDAVKNAQPGRKAKIKDFIGLAGSGAAPTYYFYYDFDLTVTASNALRLEGSMMVTNSPGASGTFYTNAANLVMELAADAGPNDNWASWSVYTAPTPANLTASAVIFDLINGTPSGLLTNLTAYSSYATNGLGGTPLSITGSNFVGALQVAFCGVNNTLVPAPSFAVVNDTNITVCVPYGAMSGPITITTQYGSGISTNIFTVDATAIQAGPTVTLVAAAPFVTAFSSTSGTPATPVCSVSGDWMAIAQATQTGPTNSNPSLVDLYNSSFGSTIMGRIAGDLAAGFALGFINSDTTNFAYQVNGTNRPYGDSPSGSWWGGNQYTAANTNSLAYHQVNTNCSPWGSLIYAATAVTYGHPIYDRMKFYSGDYSPAAIQPPVAPNSNPNIWMIEVEFLNGMASVASGGGPNSYILTYQPRTGGSISGTATQTVNTGQNGLPVEAVGSDTGVVFHAWSDGRADNPRTDSNVLANITVQAMFYSRGGADLSWYAHYGFTPGPSQQWSDLDSYAVPGKGTTLLMEYVADTNPNEIGSIFQITSFEPGSPLTVQFEYASTSRVYSIKRATDLINPAWVEMTGNMTHIAAGKGQYVAIETNQLPFKAYRMNVAAP